MVTAWLLCNETKPNSVNLLILGDLSGIRVHLELYMMQFESKAPVSQLVNAELNRRVTVKPRKGGGGGGGGGVLWISSDGDD